MPTDPHASPSRTVPTGVPRDPGETYNPRHRPSTGPISTEDGARMLTRWVLESQDEVEVARIADPSASAYMLRRIVASGGMGEEM